MGELSNNLVLPGIYSGESIEDAVSDPPPDINPAIRQLAILAVCPSRADEADGPWVLTKLVEAWTEAIHDQPFRRLTDPHEPSRSRFLAKLFPDVTFGTESTAASPIVCARVLDVASWRKRRVISSSARLALELAGPWHKNEVLSATKTSVSGSATYAHVVKTHTSPICDDITELLVGRYSLLEDIEAALPKHFANLQRRGSR